MMKITWKELTVDFSHLDRKRLVGDWQWLIGNDKLPILISSIGDLFLEDQNGKIFWLNVGAGTIQEVASSSADFRNKMNDDNLANEWFMFALVEEIILSGKPLAPNQIYSWITPPILGGKYAAENVELNDIEVHFSIYGQIHAQIKDLPDGTKIKFRIT